MFRLTDNASKKGRDLQSFSWLDKYQAFTPGRIISGIYSNLEYIRGLLQVGEYQGFLQVGEYKGFTPARRISGVYFK